MSLPQRLLEVANNSGNKPQHNHSMPSLTVDDREDSHTRYIYVCVSSPMIGSCVYLCVFLMLDRISTCKLKKGFTISGIV